MIKTWGPIWPLLAIIFIAASGTYANYFIPNAYNEHSRYNSHQAADNKNNSTDYMAAAFAAGKFIDEHNGLVSAVATVFIAAFTVVLSAATVRQVKLTRSAIQLAREEFVASHRPQIVIRQMLPSFPVNDIFVVTYQIVNSGENEASVNEHEVTISFEPGKGIGNIIQRRLELPTLAAGERHDCKVQFARDEFATAFALYTGKITIKGMVVYSDARGVKRETRFLRTYDDSKRRFTRSDDPEEEYVD